MTSPWRPTPRKRLSDQEKAQLFVDRDGRCFDCGRKVRPGERWSIEHIIALENGGTNEMTNLGICCPFCKPGKDAADHGKAAKSRRVRTKHVLPNSERKRRGFRFWRKFNGALVWRDRG